MAGHPRYTTRMLCEECNIDIVYSNSNTSSEFWIFCQDFGSQTVHQEVWMNPSLFLFDIKVNKLKADYYVTFVWELK